MTTLTDNPRLAVLDAYAVLDTPAEPEFDGIVLAASHACATPVALVSLVERHRQWFKARIGFEFCETPIEQSVCRHALTRTDLLVIPDLTRDPRTQDNPLVTGPPDMRFYAGAPLVTPSGAVIGTLCVVDTMPRPDGLTAEQAKVLQALARQVVALLELRRAVADRDAAMQREAQGKAAAVADAAKLEAMIVTQQAVAASTADLDVIFKAVVEGALCCTDAATGAVIELRDGDELVYRATSGTSARHQGIRLPLTGTLSGRALLEEMPLYCPDTEADLAVDHEIARGLGIRSMIVVPVSRRGAIIGVLKVQSGLPDAFAARDILMAQMLGGLVASAFGDVTEQQTRRALRDAESRYKAIFDSAVDFAIVAADPQSCITDWNVGAERILGWSAEDVRGKPLDVVFTPNDRQDQVPERETGGALLAGPASDVSWHRRKDGGRFWAQGRRMTLRHEDGSVRGFLTILQDRTRERRREQRLHLLAEMSAALLTSDDPASVLMGILANGAEALGFDQGFAWNLAPDGKYLLLAQSLGVGETERAQFARVPLSVPLCGVVVETGQPLVLRNIQGGTEPRFAVARDAGLNAYAGYPVTSRGRIAGVFSFAVRTTPAFDEEALAFFATAAGFLSAMRARLDAEQAVRASEERRSLAADVGEVGLWSRSLDADVFEADKRTRAMYGIHGGRSLTRENVCSAIHPDDRAQVEQAAAEQAAGLDDVLDLRYRTIGVEDGRLRHLHVNTRLMRGVNGQPIGTVGATRDVTQQAEAEDRQRVLNEEIAHRLKNTLAMVQSIAHQSLRGVEDREPVRTFERRIVALGSAHDVLLRRTWTAADLHALVAQVLRGTGQAERIDVAGPMIEFGPRAALSLALLLHKLATNAAKYGALSVEAGRVSLCWCLEGDDRTQELVLDWVERGGPPAREPTRKGFGSRLIRLGLVGTGGVSLRYLTTGFEAEMRAPLVQVQRS